MTSHTQQEKSDFCNGGVTINLFLGQNPSFTNTTPKEGEKFNRTLADEAEAWAKKHGVLQEG